MTRFLMNSRITISAMKSILSWFWVSTRIISQKLWWSSPHHPRRFDVTDSFCILRLYYTLIPLWLKWGHWGPVDNVRFSSSCRWIGKIMIGSAWLESVMIAWFMTSNANVAIIQCYVKIHQEMHSCRITNQDHLSSLLILSPRTQQSISLKRQVECET